MPSTALRSNQRRISNEARGRVNSRARTNGTTVVWGQTVVSKKTLEREATEEFSNVVCQIPAKVLARASGCTPEAAKLWKAGKRCPSWPSLRSMALSLPCIAEFVRETIPHKGNQFADSAIIAALKAAARFDTPDGHAAKRFLQMAGIE